MAITADHAGYVAEPSRGFFARLIERMTESRMEQARGYAKPRLLDLSDEELAILGHKRAEILRWKDGPTPL